MSDHAQRVHRNSTPGSPRTRSANTATARPISFGDTHAQLQAVADASPSVQGLQAMQRVANGSQIAGPVIQRLSDAQKAGLANGTVPAVRQVVGNDEGRTNALLNAATSEQELLGWVAQLAAANQTVATAKHRVDNPPLGGATQQDQQAYQQALAQRLQQYNAMIAGAQAGPGLVVGPPLAQQGQVLDAQDDVEEADPASIADIDFESFANTSTDHGNYTSQSGAVTVTRAGLEAYITNNGDLLYTGIEEGRQKFVEDLGPSQTAEDGDWSLVVLFNTGTRRATVRHFGPFGPGNAAAVVQNL